MGDLKLVERPQNYTLGPGAQQAIRHASIEHPVAYRGSTLSTCLLVTAADELQSRPNYVRKHDKRLSRIIPHQAMMGNAASLVHHGHVICHSARVFCRDAARSDPAERCRVWPAQGQHQGVEHGDGRHLRQHCVRGDRLLRPLCGKRHLKPFSDSCELDKLCGITCYLSSAGVRRASHLSW